jgi:N-acetylglucosaminyldiphosphoundecaprenol N-acetyl-beta-D-mannosaminyltransferase
VCFRARSFVCGSPQSLGAIGRSVAHFLLATPIRGVVACAIGERVASNDNSAYCDVPSRRITSHDACKAPRSLAQFDLLGVTLDNLSTPAALKTVLDLLDVEGRTSVIHFANAHTLTLADGSERLKQLLNSATHILADGLGVRLGAMLNGVRLANNLCGTDFIPKLLSTDPGCKRRYYLLGATPRSIANAAKHAAAAFPHWKLVGFHHGYFHPESSTRIVEQINLAKPDLLLVGMGSPLQEDWLAKKCSQLNVPLCMGVGGLFDFWSNQRSRAPRLMRKCSLEWLYIAATERHKWRRYTFGASRYLARVVSVRATSICRAISIKTG